MRTISLIASAAVAATLAIAPPANAHRPDGVWKTRNHVEDRARSQKGAPYRSGGTSPRGFDCSGFTRWTFSELNVSLPHSSTDQFKLARRDRVKRIWKRKNLKTGDLVFHKTTSARVGHAGIYIGDGKFISSTSSEGVAINSIYDRYYWGRRWVGATRLVVTQNR